MTWSVNFYLIKIKLSHSLMGRKRSIFLLDSAWLLVLTHIVNSVHVQMGKSSVCL